MKDTGKMVLAALLTCAVMYMGTTYAAEEAPAFQAALESGRVHQEAGRYDEARAEYEKALAVEGISPDQQGRALTGIGEVYIAQKKIQDGIVALRKARALAGISNETRIRANLLFGQTYLRYPWVLDQARDAFLEIADLPELTAEQKTAVRKGLVAAYMGLRQFGEARSMMTALASDPNLTPEEKPANQIAIGTTCFLEGEYAEARAELKKALGMEGVSDAQKADIQLKTALSYYEAGDHERAKPELEKVLSMPGADAPAFRSDGFGNYVASPARAAKLRLLKMEPAGQEDRPLAVLFIGSSLTIRGWMPLVVEQLSEFAPADRPRIMAGMYTRGGTGIEVFWEDGETRDTARGMIASMPWDMVVMETTSLRKSESNLKYAKLFSDFVRSKNMRLLFYESQVRRDDPYPDAHQKYHQDEVALAKTSESPLAPVVLAQLKYLEAVPNAEIGSFYSDWIHPSSKGMYMAAYCIYSAITGTSPVGLSHPDSVSAEDAKAMQEAAWTAVQEANPDLTPLD